MLIEKVIDHYVELGKKPQGNPFRLSNSGRCARALAYQRFPSTFKPEPMPARVLMVLEEGKRVDKWLKEEFRKHCQKSWGWDEITSLEENQRCDLSWIRERATRSRSPVAALFDLFPVALWSILS